MSPWDQLMTTRHYLGHHHLVGKSLKYVAKFDGKWVALLGWASPAFKCGARDTWIGWSKEQQWKRLEYIVLADCFSGLHNWKMFAIAEAFGINGYPYLL